MKVNEKLEERSKSFGALVYSARPRAVHVYVLLGVALLLLAIGSPLLASETLEFVVRGFVNVAPLVVPGILLGAWVAASGAGDHVAHAFQRNKFAAITIATIVGAVLPVCGITVLPLMAGLLGAGVPLAPVMAFWLASPITGPPMLAATIATLGWEFAAGKLLSAIGLGLFGGIVTALFARYDWVGKPLRAGHDLSGLGKSCGAISSCFRADIWRESYRVARFWREVGSISRLLVTVLVPAFAAEHLLNTVLQPDGLTVYVGEQSVWAVPVAVLVGAPAYIDGYAALPLTRALISHGMSPGATIAFLVSGSVVSIWGAMAIFPVLRLKTFLLYLFLAAVGSMLCGWVFDVLV